MKHMFSVTAILIAVMLFAFPALAKPNAPALNLSNDLHATLKTKAGELTWRLIEMGNPDLRTEGKSNLQLQSSANNQSKFKDLYLWDPTERPKEFGIGQSSSSQVGGGLSDAVNDNGSQNAPYVESGPSLDGRNVQSPMPVRDEINEMLSQVRVGGGFSDPVNDIAGLDQPYVEEGPGSSGNMPQSPLAERNDVQNKEQASASIGGGYDNPVDDNGSIDNPKPAQNSNDFAPKFNREQGMPKEVTYNPGDMSKNPGHVPGMFAHPGKTHEALMKPGHVGRWDLD